MDYWVASTRRLLKIRGLFCRRAQQKRRYSAKETYNFKEPTNRSHLILCSLMKYGPFLVYCEPRCVDMGLFWWNAGLFRRNIIGLLQRAVRLHPAATMQHAATHVTGLLDSIAPVMTPKNCNTRRQTAPQNCNTLQQTATHCTIHYWTGS